MAKGDLGKFVGGFGESFLKTLQSERERTRKEQEFNQEMSFRTRQMNLMNTLYQQRQDLDQAQFDFKRDQPYETKAGDVFPTKEGQPDFTTPLWQMPRAPEKIEGTKDPRVGSDGFIHRWDENKGEYIKTNLKAPEKDVKGSTDGGGGGGGKENQISLWQLEGINALENPIYTGEDSAKNEVPLTPKQLQENLDDNVNRLATIDLGSREQKWLKDISKRYGRYPSPQELQQEIIKHATPKDKGGHGTLTDDNVSKLERFLNRYYGLYGGVNEVQRRILNPKYYEQKTK